MWGGIFALLKRSLRSEERLVRTHLFRLLFVAITYIFLITTQAMSDALGAPGLNLFRQICYLNFACITLAALSVFATSITEEKEDMTLGLLKMAGISPLALLLGKSMPRLVAAMLLLSVQFPFTMLAITLGGVSLQQVLAAYFSLLAYLVLAANLALFFSVVSLRSRTAGLATGIVLGLYFFGPFFMTFAKMGLTNRGYLTAGGLIDRTLDEVLIWIGSTSAFRRMFAILATGFADPVISFQVVSNLVVGVGFCLLSWLAFEPCTRNERPPAEPRKLLFKRIGFWGRLGPNRAWSTAALTWKDFHFTAGGKMMILSKYILYASVLGFISWTMIQLGGRFRLEEFGQSAMTLGMMAIAVEAGVHASRVFYTEVKWRTLSSIAMLPQSIGEIAYSKLLGCSFSFVPALTFLILGMICAPESAGDAIEEILTEEGAWYAISQYFVFLHLAALLSLFVKWGAFPLAIAVVYLGNGLFGSMLSLLFFRTGFDEGIFLLFTVVSIALCVTMQYWTGQRLKLLAAR